MPAGKNMKNKRCELELSKLGEAIMPSYPGTLKAQNRSSLILPELGVLPWRRQMARVRTGFLDCTRMF